MTNSANLYAHIEPGLKEQDESILTALGIPTSTAITMFYKQIVLLNGLPFASPTAQPIDLNNLTQRQLNAKLEQGYAALAMGQTKAAKGCFADVRKEYGG